MRIRQILIAIVLVLSVVLPGCGNGPEVEVREVVSQIIDAEEGGNITITEEDSANLAGLQLYIPPGALESDQEITIGEVLGGLPSHSGDYVWLGRQISLQPAGLSFARPVTLRMVFSEEEWQAWNGTVPAEDMLLMKLDESSGDWVTVPSQIHENVLTADIESFSFWDVVFFWRPSDPASDSKIRDRAERWGAPDGWDLDSRLQSKEMFVDHSKPPVSTTDLTFADKIRALLLVEAMWDKIEDGNFDAGASLAEIVLKNVAEDVVKDLVAKALEIPTLGVAYSVASLVIDSTLEYLREQLHAVMFNNQLKAYLSWRGWFFVKQGNQWVWIYNADLANDHQAVLTDPIIPRNDEGWLMCYQVADGTLRDFSYKGTRVPSEGSEELYNLGNELCGLFVKVGEEEWVPEVGQYLDGLQADRVWLEYAFSGWNMPPAVTINAPNSGEVGRSVTLQGEVTDFEDEPVIWLWQQTSGPAVELVYYSTLQPHFIPTEPGIYGFTLEGWDLLLENHNSASVVTVVGEQPSKVYLTISSANGGSVNTPGVGTFPYDAGTVVNLVATPASGYRFVSWTGDVGAIANINAASTAITMNGDYSITANFVRRYNLTISSTAGGTVTTPGTGTFTYDKGTVVNLVATPAAGYRFVSWTGNVGTIANVNAASTTITMNGDYSIRANFGTIPPVRYNLTITSTAGGTVTTPGTGTFTYDAGTVVNLVATPANGYRFVNWTGDVGTIANVKAAMTSITMHGHYSITGNFEETQYIPGVAAGDYHTVGLRSDGTVVAVGYNYEGQCNVGDWTDIVQVAAGEAHTAGLKSDGTVVAIGSNGDGQCNVGGWTDIIQVAAGDYHTVGVKSDGTVVAVGSNGDGQCNIGSWTGIVQVAAGDRHTVGVKSDGTVVAVGYNIYGQCNIGSWTGIVQVAAGIFHTVGLRSDGTALATGYPYHGQCNVTSWTDIVQVAAGGCDTVGLRSNGTVVVVGDNAYGQCNIGSWMGIVQVAAGGRGHTVGLKSDGTVMAVGYDYFGQCNIGSWTGIGQVAAGDYHTVGLKSDGTVVAVGRNSYGQCNIGSWTDIIQVAAREAHTVGLKSDGTVVAVGYNDQGQCNVGGWMGIVQVAAGDYHTVGLKSDGTVVAIGSNGDGQCNVGGWTDIIQVAAGSHHTVGVRSDGTAVAVGWNNGQCSVGGWTGIIQVAAGAAHTVGVKSNGMVVAVGYNDSGQCNVGSWTYVVQVAAGPIHTVGVKSNGTVVAVGWNGYGQCNVGGWTEIIQASAGYLHTVGLKSGGTVVAAGPEVELAKWDLF